MPIVSDKFINALKISHHVANKKLVFIQKSDLEKHIGVISDVKRRHNFDAEHFASSSQFDRGGEKREKTKTVRNTLRFACSLV